MGVNNLDYLITDEILNVLMIATTFSLVLMPLIQKCKRLNIIKSDSHICILNLLLSLSLGSLFAISFFELNWINSLWVGVFSFVEAPAIYHILKKQNIINYTPITLDEIKKDNLIIPITNIINREEE